LYEVDFLAVGEAGRHGDAIAIRFTRPDTGAYAHVVIDAGFDQNGRELVEHIQEHYDISAIDLAIVTHPDGDHIGGMGHVIRDLDVDDLWIHRLGNHGSAALAAADAVDDLIKVAEANGTAVHEPFAGRSAFGGALTILGPEEAWYDELVGEQLAEERRRASRSSPALLEAARLRGQKFLAELPGAEIPFGDAGGTNPRNNSSAITLLEVDGRRLLFTSDAGVPSLDRAWDWLEQNGGDTSPPPFVQLPHHGSRHNASSSLLNRLLGRTGQEQTRTAFVNVAPEAVKHPSPRVTNGFMRRGYKVHQTRGKSRCHGHDAPNRPGWGPSTPMEPLDESAEEE
jgi:beta-lactamase superfamily II metal-dependent hydrolase